jgi:hypothetical protein
MKPIILSSRFEGNIEYVRRVEAITKFGKKTVLGLEIVNHKFKHSVTDGIAFISEHINLGGPSPFERRRMFAAPLREGRKLELEVQKYLEDLKAEENC